MWMWIIAIGWMFVVVIAALAEAVSPTGSVLGGIVTFVFYGVVPLTLLMYVMGTRLRRMARLASEHAERAQARAAAEPAGSGKQPDAGSLTTRDPVASIGKKP